MYPYGKTQEVTDLYGDKHEVVSRHLNNKRKALIKVVGSTSHSACFIHRDNIIKPDTIGFQVINRKGKLWKLKKNQVVESSKNAAKLLLEAMTSDLDAGWRTIQVKDLAIDNPEFI